MTDQERLDEIERDWAHVRATGGAVDLEECGTCSEAFAAVPWLLAELRAAQDAIEEHEQKWNVLNAELRAAQVENERLANKPHCCPPCAVHPDPEPRQIARIAASIDMAQIVAQGGVDTGWLVAHILRESGISAEPDALAAKLEAVRAELLMGGQNADARCRAALLALDAEADHA